VKTGLLAVSTIIVVVVQIAAVGRLPNLVVDPVMFAKGGSRLLGEDAVAALRDRLLPLAVVATPNGPEAEALAGIPVETVHDAREAARRIRAMGARVVIVKGGHLHEAESIDVVYDGQSFDELRAPRIVTRNTHGTGCTFSAAIAAQLALGRTPLEAARRAKAYVSGAIAAGRALGAGHGPLEHFWRGVASD
jgi:hydroxymethylpyrimidine/phosphomethylpyrimidine kinase